MSTFIITDEHLRQAREAGQEAGRAAGTWAADGNTSAEHAERVLKMLADGDPEAWDHLPRRPNLSGEFADDPTPRSIAEELGIDFDGARAPAELDPIEEAWQEGVDETFEDACQVELSRHVPLTLVVGPDLPPVRSGETERVNAERGIVPPEHDCMEHAVPYESDGALGHGWECGVCGAFLQAG